MRASRRSSSEVATYSLFRYAEKGIVGRKDWLEPPGRYHPYGFTPRREISAPRKPCPRRRIRVSALDQYFLAVPPRYQFVSPPLTTSSAYCARDGAYAIRRNVKLNATIYFASVRSFARKIKRNFSDKYLISSKHYRCGGGSSPAKDEPPPPWSFNNLKKKGRSGHLSASAFHCADVGGEEAVETINNRSNFKHWRAADANSEEKTLVKRLHPPVNVLGGYKHSGAPVVDLAPSKPAASEVQQGKALSTDDRLDIPEFLAGPPRPPEAAAQYHRQSAASVLVVNWLHGAGREASQHSDAGSRRTCNLSRGSTANWMLELTNSA